MLLLERGNDSVESAVRNSELHNLSHCSMTWLQQWSDFVHRGEETTRNEDLHRSPSGAACRRLAALAFTLYRSTYLRRQQTNPQVSWQFEAHGAIPPWQPQSIPNGRTSPRYEYERYFGLCPVQGSTKITVRRRSRTPRTEMLASPTVWSLHSVQFGRNRCQHRTRSAPSILYTHHVKQRRRRRRSINHTYSFPKVLGSGTETEFDGTARQTIEHNSRETGKKAARRSDPRLVS